MKNQPKRPPFADFSSIAVREMMKWIGGRDVWASRMENVLDEHVEPVSKLTGLDFDEIVDDLGEFFGPAMGAVFEDLCTRCYEVPPENVVDDFLKKRGHRLPPLAKVYLTALRDSFLSVYEVTAVEPGRGVTARDVLVEGEPIAVTEVMGSRALLQWDLIAARIVRHGDQSVFTGAVTPLKPEDASSLKKELGEALHRLAEGRIPALTSEQFRAAAGSALQDLAPAIGAVRIGEIVASRRRPLPELRNADGDPIEFIEAQYRFAKADREEIVTRLDSQPVLQRAGKRPPAWIWLSSMDKKSGEPPTPAEPSVGEGLFEGVDAVSLLHITLSGTHLTLTVNSRERLGKARALIEPLLSPLVGSPELDMHSVEEMMQGEGDGESPDEADLPPQVSNQMMREYLDRHYRRVLDDKIPMLGGRTPREASRDAAGRELLVELLKHYENSQARQARDGGFEYDFGWMWRELGIEHLRR